MSSIKNKKKFDVNFNRSFDDIETVLRRKDRELSKENINSSFPLSFREECIIIMANICGKLEYTEEVFDQTLTYFDRYCSRIPLSCNIVDKLVIISCACVSIAAKIEEDSPYSLDDICEVYLFVFSFNVSRYEIINIEADIANKLNWDFIFPTVSHYQHHYMTKNKKKYNITEDDNEKIMKMATAVSYCVRITYEKKSTYEDIALYSINIALICIIGKNREKNIASFVEKKIDWLSEEMIYACVHTCFRMKDNLLVNLSVIKRKLAWKSQKGRNFIRGKDEKDRLDMSIFLTYPKFVKVYPFPRKEREIIEKEKMKKEKI